MTDYIVILLSHTTMARRIFELLQLPVRRAIRRERIFLDRRNPMEIFSDSHLRDRYRFSRTGILYITNLIAPEIEHATRRNCALLSSHKSSIFCWAAFSSLVAFPPPVIFRDLVMLCRHTRDSLFSLDNRDLRSSSDRSTCGNLARCCFRIVTHTSFFILLVPAYLCLASIVFLCSSYISFPRPNNSLFFLLVLLEETSL